MLTPPTTCVPLTCEFATVAEPPRIVPWCWSARGVRRWRGGSHSLWAQGPRRCALLAQMSGNVVLSFSVCFDSRNLFRSRRSPRALARLSSLSSQQSRSCRRDKRRSASCNVFEGARRPSLTVSRPFAVGLAGVSNCFEGRGADWRTLSTLSNCTPRTCPERGPLLSFNRSIPRISPPRHRRP